MTAAFHPMSNASNPELMVVDTAALNLVAKMPDNYAAMSHYEFFAEMYVLYYDYDDPKRKPSPPQWQNGWTKTSANATRKIPAGPAARRKPG